MAEAVGYADGDLDPVVGRLEPGVGVSEPDGSDDVGSASPDFVGRVAHPADDVEPVGHAFGVRAPPADARVDPAGPVPGDDADGGAPFGRQRLEEQVEHVPADPVVRPDDPMPLVVDDHGQVCVALAVAGLVHADRVQSVERRRNRRLGAFRDPMGDGARRSSTTHEGNR